jgi:hypothetical protein
VKSIDYTKYLGYGVSFVSLTAGCVFLFDISMPRNFPLHLRVMCGVVFLLMAAYRFVATRYKVREYERAGQ